MDEQFWKQKWETGDTKFHQSQVHPWLRKNVKRFSEGKVLVPLCGKSLDLLFLASQGFEVVGIELSPIACESFFTENNLAFQKDVFREFTIYRTPNITVWCGDFFKTPQETFDGISGIYDRAALVALPNDLREAYAAHLLEQTSHLPRLGILLLTFEYSDPKLKGPPFSVAREEIDSLFGKKFEIEEILSESNGDFVAHHPKLSTFQITEKGYWILKK